MCFSIEVWAFSCLRSTSGHRQQTRDVLFLSSSPHFPNIFNGGLIHFDGDILSGQIFLDFKVTVRPPPTRLLLLPSPQKASIFFFLRISQDLECHTGVISAYLAPKQPAEVKECTLLFRSSLKRPGKQLPTHPLTLPLCAVVRLRRRRSRTELLVLPLTCTTALSLTHQQSALYLWK